MTDLGATQRWFGGVITDRAGIGAGAALAFGETSTLAPEDVIHGSSALSATERLHLYARTYRQRLVGCLRESYPGLCHALGDELFDDFALDYLQAQPSRSYTLATLGAGWPAHLEATRPDRDLPAHEREQWPDFLVDLARLEQTFSEVFDAPGVEGDILPTAADIPDPGDRDARWDAVAITPVACLRILEVRFPVGGYLVAARRGESPRMPAPARCFVVVSRRDYVVTITQIDTAAHALLVELMAGVSVHGAASGAGLALPEACRLVAAWANRGLIAAIEASRPERPVVQSTRGVVR